MTRLAALVQSALCGGLMRAAFEKASSDPNYRAEARRLAGWSRAYGRTAGLNVPMPRPRGEESDS